ncbi:hypothetical protein BBP40_002890 [Aspergillus hancockii]|nr:hypothetical protein BBP40_002890 [Aspergillus hancockii]
MSLHLDYEPNYAVSRVLEPQGIKPTVTPGLTHNIIQVRDTPASGKSTPMDLMTNRLFEMFVGNSILSARQGSLGENGAIIQPFCFWTKHNSRTGITVSGQAFTNGLIAYTWLSMCKVLFSDPQQFFKDILGSQFTRGLPSLESPRQSGIVLVFKAALPCDGISKSSHEKEDEEFQKAPVHIWRNGWFHAEQSHGEVRVVFTTQIHRLYCHSLYDRRSHDELINHSTPLDLAVAAIQRFQPRQISDAYRSAVAGSRAPLGDLFLKEFYRCMFPILNGHCIMTLGSVINTSPKGATIDVLIVKKE